MKADRPRIIPVDELKNLYIDVFEAAGASTEDARFAAEPLLDADLCGTDTHGIARIPIYVDRIIAGGIDPKAEIEVVADHGSTLVVDGHDGIGQVVAYKSALLSIERADRHGISAVAVRRSNHLGALAYYTRIAVEQDQIGLLISGVASTLAPWGAGEALLGSNPWSVACPAGRHDPVVLDVANGIVTSSIIRDAIDRGTEIPEGVAVGPDGTPTTDPNVALEGSILPIGGHKGYGLTLVWEILASVMTGAAFSRHITKFESPGVPKGIGHLFINIDIARLLDPAEFRSRVDELLDILLAARTPDPDTAVRYPGMRSAEVRRIRLEAGVPVDPLVFDKVVSSCRELGAEGALQILGAAGRA